MKKAVVILMFLLLIAVLAVLLAIGAFKPNTDLEAGAKIPLFGKYTSVDETSVSKGTKVFPETKEGDIFEYGGFIYTYGVRSEDGQYYWIATEDKTNILSFFAVKFIRINGHPVYWGEMLALEVT